MKKLIYITIVLFFSLPLGRGWGWAQTSVYHPFPDSNAVWEVIERGESPFYDKIFKYFLDGDTTINIINYTKLKRVGQCVHCYESGYFGMDTTLCFSDTCYIGGLRNDTLQKKVYILFSDSVNETLLYDFNLNIGDTINYYYPVNSEIEFPVTLTCIDSVVVGQLYRKRYEFEGCPQEIYYWIEGVGGGLGLMERASFFETGFILYRFTQNDTIIYYPWLGINEKIDKTFVLLYPNPAYDYVDIFFDNQFELTGMRIKVFNILGQEEEINFKIQPNNISVKVNMLKEGIFFFRIYNGEQLVKTEKIIVITK